MNRSELPRLPDGFLHIDPGTPALSIMSTKSISDLPHPQKRAFKPGSNKEDMVRTYAEAKMKEVARRYVRRFSDPEPGDDVVGYKSFVEVCRDLDEIINVIWLSGTPSLQVQFLLNIASEFTKYVADFSPSPKATFGLLGKLDHCFASLLKGADIRSNEPLPGFENGLQSGMTTTDMIRCRSTVEQSRSVVAEALANDNSSGAENEYDDDDDDDDNDDNGPMGDSLGNGSAQDLNVAEWTEEEETLLMDVARIYENTLVCLGERLGSGL